MRFTSRAKHAVFFDARDQAGAMGHGYVGGEHILLALLGEREGLAARVLDSCGITLEQVLGQVSRIGGAGGESPARLDHNGEATQVVEVAQTESGALGHERVGTAHVLLALLSQGGGAAVKVVRGLGEIPSRCAPGCSLRSKLATATTTPSRRQRGKSSRSRRARRADSTTSTSAPSTSCSHSCAISQASRFGYSGRSGSPRGYAQGGTREDRRRGRGARRADPTHP